MIVPRAGLRDKTPFAPLNL